MELLINKYCSDLEKANEPIDKIAVIIGFIQSCEQLHPFVDGNCRTFCMLLLNHLLMRNEFPPAILGDPNKFDMFSKSEILNMVLEGMQNTITLIKTGSLYNINTNLIMSDLMSKPCFATSLAYFKEIVNSEEADRMSVTHNKYALK